jgi:hypothetical protein
VTPVKKVISGFQTGADIAGIRAAHSLHLATGGWMPKGWRTMEGAHPEYQTLYGAEEDEHEDYPTRTKRNIIAAHGTLIVGRINELGTGLTLRLCKKYEKPFLHILYNWKAPEPELRKYFVDLAREWLDREMIEILNVAGNRAEVNLGIEQWTESFVREVLT